MGFEPNQAFEFQPLQNFINPLFYFSVTGKVNGVKFDRDHILTVNGNQVITGKKYFDLSNYPNNTLKMNTLNVSGLIDGIDFKDLIKNQAYKSRDLVFTKRMNFTNGMKANLICLQIETFLN